MGVALICTMTIMVVGIFASLQQNSGFSATIQFNATNVSLEVAGKVYGTTELTAPTLNTQTILPSDTAGTINWNITGSGEDDSLVPSSDGGYTIVFAMAIRNIAGTGGTSCWIIPSAISTAVGNIAPVSYRQYVYNSPIATETTLSTTNVDTYHNDSNVVNKTVDFSPTANKAYCSNSSGSFGLRIIDGTSNALEPNNLFYFEVVFAVQDLTLDVSATSINFGLLITSDQDTLENNMVAPTSTSSLSVTEGTSSVTITSIDSSLTEIVIPSTVNGKPVRFDSSNYWGPSTFTDNTKIESLTIPDTITSLPSYLCRGCTSLTSVSIPDSVTYIGQSAFEGCTNLTSVEMSSNVTGMGWNAFKNSAVPSLIIPNTVTSIGRGAFGGCSGLESIYIPDSVVLEANGLGLFGSCSNLKYANWPTATTIINNWAFQSCTSLEYVEIPGEVTEIGDRAFMDCHSLISLELPNTITKIGTAAFMNCYSLQTINIPTSLVTVSGRLFECCYNLSGELIFPSTVTDLSADYRNFFNCYSLTSIQAPGVTKMGWGTFYNNQSLTNLVLSNNVTYINDSYNSGDTFYNCPWWNNIINGVTTELPSFVTKTNGIFYIGKVAMKAVLSEISSSVTLKSDTTEIFSACFNGATDLTSVSMPNTIEYIYNYAFYNCTNLSSVTMSTAVKNISASAFRNCSSLPSITLPSTLTSIGEYAFFESGLTSLTLLEGLTNVGRCAFAYTDITSVIIPNSVTYMNYLVFQGTKITSLNIPANLTSIGGELYTGNTLNYITVDSANTVYESGSSSGGSNCIIEIATKKLIQGCNNSVLPTDLIILGGGAFKESNISSVTIPSTCTQIDKQCFAYITNGLTVRIPTSVVTMSNQIFYGSTMTINIAGISSAPSGWNTNWNEWTTKCTINWNTA